MDMCRLTFAPASFEGIWCCASLLHVPKAQASEAVGQMRQVLVPGGMLYLSILEGEREAWEKAAHLAGAERLFVRYAPEEARALLTQANFSVVEYYRDVADAARTWLNFIARAGQ